MTEEIAFSDWSKRLDRSINSNDLSDENGTDEQGTNSWLPAYGFYQPSAALQQAFLQNKNIEFYFNDMVDGAFSNHLLLETIMEETSDDLRSETSESEYNCGLLTDSLSTVIHVPSLQDMRHFKGARNTCRRNLKKCKVNTEPGVRDEDDDIVDDFTDDDDSSSDSRDDSDEDTDQAGADDIFPPRTNSLLQFENLEKHYENIFRSQHSSSISTFDSPNFENRRPRDKWRFKSNSQPEKLNNLRDIDDDNNDSSSLSSSCSSSSSSSEIITSDEIFSSPFSCKYDSLYRKLSLRSFRSVDSLISLRQKQEKEQDLFHSSDLSQSLNDNISKINKQKNEMVTPPGQGIYKTMECLIEFTDEDHKEAGKKGGVVKSGRSAENLSEDSGFGEHISSKERTTEIVESQIQSHDERCVAEGSKFSFGVWHDNSTTSVIGNESSDKQLELEDSSSIVMASRLSVASTPNLYNGINEEYHYEGSEEAGSLRESTIPLSKVYALKRINFESESRLSTLSKGSNVQFMTSFMNLGGSLGGSSTGVYVSPVVSEVSRQREYSSRSNSSESVPSVPQGHEIVQKLTMDSMTSTSKHSEYEVRSQQARLLVISSPSIVRAGGGSHVMNVDCDANKSPSWSSSSQLTSTGTCETFVDMNSSIASQTTKEKSPSKLGGFFQRFSLKRLSGRKNKEKKSKTSLPVVVGCVPKIGVAESRIVSLVDGGQIEVSAQVCNKPPLPPTAPGCRRPSDDTANPVPSRSSIPYSQQCGGDRNTPTMLCKPTLQQIGGDLLETDIDSNFTSTTSSTSNGSPGGNKRSKSLLNLDNGRMPINQLTPADRSKTTILHHTCNDYRAKSMEFLLNKENQDAVKAPENELQKGNGERKMSEHELRVQRSLQKLNVPEWYKNSAVPSQGFLLKRHSDAGQNQQTHQRWNANTLPSKTTSLSSLGFALPSTPRSPTCGTVTSPGPSQSSFSRWSTSRLNSGTNSSSTSPCSSARSSFNYRQPYLGWRSQEKLSKPRTPAERLAAGLLPQNAQNGGSQQFSPSLNEVRSSIKEVTSAIVHYVSVTKDSSDRLSPSPRCTTNSSSRSTSPRGSTGKLCWLESSFVGSRPLNAFEMPTVLSENKVTYLQPKPLKKMSDDKKHLENSQNCYDNSSHSSPVNNGEYLLA